MYYIYIYDNYTPSNVPISEPSTRNERESEMPSFPQCKEGVQRVSRNDGQHPPAITPINQPINLHIICIICSAMLPCTPADDPYA